MSTIADLPDLIAALPETQHQRVCRLLRVTLDHGQALVPPPMRSWALRHFGDLGAVEQQQVVRVRNRVTLEEALFNPLRARRPIERITGDLDSYVVERLAAGDIFADPHGMTTADTFGRIKGRFCVSAANVAKVAGWHGLVIFDEPFPLRFGAAQVCDYLDVALRWLHTAHAADPQACYPLIIWNCLPRSGATMMHGHLQMALTNEQHYMRVENWRRAALSYGQPHGLNTCSSYFDDLMAVHGDLGLACYERDGVRGFVSLTPTRSREVVLLAPKLSAPLAEALAAVLRALIDGQGVASFNAAVYLPPLAPTDESWQGFPVVARVVDRGDPWSLSSDLGAIEIFASNAIHADPFDVARMLHEAQL